MYKILIFVSSILTLLVIIIHKRTLHSTTHAHWTRFKKRRLAQLVCGIKSYPVVFLGRYEVITFRKQAYFLKGRLFAMIAKLRLFISNGNLRFKKSDIQNWNLN